MEANLSRNIQQYILDLLDGAEEENFISLRRKELAEMFNCVPSQINYVLRSRFTPQHGYLIESRRGEYGYIKIVKVSYDTSKEKAEHVKRVVGKKISFNEARRLLENLQERNFITQRERLAIEIALEDAKNNSSSTEEAEHRLAGLLEKMLCALIME